jgi:hypothetical protein
VRLEETRFLFAGLPTVARTEEVDPEITMRRIADARQRLVDALRRNVAFQERLVNLTAGPGGELQAIERIARLRIEAAEREFRITQDRARYEAAVDEARKMRIVEIAELQRRQLEEFRDAAGRVFDALVARGGIGLRDLLRGQMLTVARQVFVNVATELFRGLGGTLGRAIPGQRDEQGRPTLLGRILSGTIFAQRDEALRVATDVNTQATVQNTAAVVGLTRALSSVRAVGGDGAAASFDLDGIDILGGATQAGAEGAKRGFLVRHQRLIGAIGAAAAGALGVIASAREGGARGAVGAAGSAAGAAGAILSIAGVSGPAAPILAGVGLALGMIHSLFGDPREKRERELERRLSQARFREPEPLERMTTVFGGDVDYDLRGRVRVLQRQNVTVNINALDAKSVMDRSIDIADAVRRALQDGHPLAAQIHHVVGIN